MFGTMKITVNGVQTTVHLGGNDPARFDAAYYLRKNPDVARALADRPGFAKTMGAVQHFLDNGAKELRNPNPLFDMKAYVNANPDVAASGVNPFLQFANHGRAEGRPSFAVPGEGRQPRTADVASLQDTLPGPAHGAMSFQADPAAQHRASGLAAPALGAQDVWAHGSALMQPAAVAGGAYATPMAAPQPAGLDVMPLAGIGTILPGAAAPQEIQLLRAA